MELLPVPLDINFNRGNDEMIFEMSFFRGMASALVPIPLSIDHLPLLLHWLKILS